MQLHGWIPLFQRTVLLPSSPWRSWLISLDIVLCLGEASTMYNPLDLDVYYPFQETGMY